MAGISTFATFPAGVGPYLKPLIDFAVSVIPSSAHATTPIYLLATAGMRLLPQSQQSAILSATCTYLKQSYNFRLHDCTNNIRIITGEEEGLYGWIAVNYLMDGFDKHEHAHKGEPHSSTYGFLDMGGASTQIAFEPSESEQVKHADNLLKVKMKLLSGKEVTHPVFVTTFLGFGTNQARGRYVDQEIKAFTKLSDEQHQESGSTEIAAGGATEKIVFVDDPCLPKDLMLTEARHSGYTLRGTGDFSQCVKKTGPLLNKEVECLDLPCLFNGVHVPAIDFSVNHFIGISEYWYSTQDVWSMGNIYDFVQFEKNAMEYCGRNWKSIMADHEKGEKWKSNVELSRLETQCFKAAWIVNILHEGSGIPRIIDEGGEGTGKAVGEKGMGKAKDKGLLEGKRKRPPSFQSLNQVKDVSISWTLGKMVLEVAQGSTSAGQLDLTLSESPLADTPTLPDVSSGVGSTLTSDWRGHIPAWSGDIRATLSPLATIDPFAYLAFAVILFFAYFFCLSSTSSRRRKSFFSGIFPSKRRGEYGLMSSSDDSSDSSPPRSGGGSRRGGPSSAGWLGPVRWVVFRFSTTLRNWSRPTSAGSGGSPFGRGSLLPMNGGAVSAGPTGGTRFALQPPPIRPRPLRQTSSSRPPLTSSTPVHPTPNSHWNDAPDVSDRDKSATTKSSLYLNFRTTDSPPPPLPSHIPPPPQSSSSIDVAPVGLSSSRPTTPGPGWTGSTLPFNKLTSRVLPSTTSTYTESRTSTPSTIAVDESSGSFLGSVTSSLSNSNERSTPPIAGSEDIDMLGESPGRGGGAKLRSSKSQNNSRVDLAGTYFGGGRS